jgi:hypothetical protein
VKTLKTATEKNLALMLELKERIGPEATSVQERLDGARKSLDRLLEQWA